MDDLDGICEAQPFLTDVIFNACLQLWTEFQAIEVPTSKEYLLAFRAALWSSWDVLFSWGSLFILLLSPVGQLLVIMARAAWPPARIMALAVWRHQASLSTVTLCAEAASVILVIVLVMLRRFIIRRRYIPRVQRSIRLLRARVNRIYLSFAEALERNFRLSARALPHVVYWLAAGLVMGLAPEFASTSRDLLWVWFTVTWPTLYASYLLLLIRSRDGAHELRVAPQDMDQVFMYWVVFSVTSCCGALAGFVPFFSPLLESMVPPTLRSATFWVVVWMHLPGTGSGTQVVYGFVKGLVPRFVMNLREAEGFEGGLQRMSDVFVFLRIMTNEHAQMLADIVADSWLLLPVPLLFFTPGSIANLVCMYTGLAVPALNSVKALGRRPDARLGRRAALASAAGNARVRWLTYWVAFGGWWHVARFFEGVYILPFTRQLQLLFFLWLQVPVFRGAIRIFDFMETCIERWAPADPREAPAAIEN